MELLDLLLGVEHWWVPYIRICAVLGGGTLVFYVGRWAERERLAQPAPTLDE